MTALVYVALIPAAMLVLCAGAAILEHNDTAGRFADRLGRFLFG